MIHALRCGVAAVALSLSCVATAQALDPTSHGPLSVTEKEYKFPAQVHADILTDRQTELWARVYLPTEGSALPDETMPVIVFLHGNHGTCGTGINPRRDNNSAYTTTGSCPAGYVPTPNHRGYDYIARNLASWGYFVVSINANRGITSGGGVSGDSGLNLARGRLVLKHLELLSTWNRQGGSEDLIDVDLTNKLDFGEVGLVGHSRGGEGVRAAYNFYQPSDSSWRASIGPMDVRAIFEIAPVDGQTARTLNAFDVPWAVLLPLCDGDVSTLEGVRPFDRMFNANNETNFSPKSTFVVWGANHNYFNTEWQTSDASGCNGHQPIFNPGDVGSSQQQTVGTYGVAGFLRAHVGPQKLARLKELFDPAWRVPTGLSTVTTIDRDFVSGLNAARIKHLVGWDRDTVVDGHGVTLTRERLSYHHDRLGLRVQWTNRAGRVTVKLPREVVTAEDSIDISLIARGNAQITDFSLALELPDGRTLPSVPLSDFVSPRSTDFRLLLQTVRIPATAFGITADTEISGLGLTLDRTDGGVVVLSTVRLIQNGAIGEGLPDLAVEARHAQRAHPMSLTRPLGVPAVAGQIESIVRTKDPEGQDIVEMTIAAPGAFMPRDALPILTIADKEFNLARQPDAGIDRMTFILPAELKELESTSRVLVGYGHDHDGQLRVAVDAGVLP